MSNKILICDTAITTYKMQIYPYFVQRDQQNYLILIFNSITNTDSDL